jgi:signal peptidase
MRSGGRRGEGRRQLRSTGRRGERGHRRSAGARRARRAAATLALLLVAALAAAILVPAIAGYKRYVVTGGSMGATLPRGSIAYERLVPTSSIRTGDVITYRPPAASRLVTHRVVWTGRDRHGDPAFRTRGDANRSADPWRFTLRSREQARVAFHIPLVGYAVAALSERPLRMAVLGGPALLVALTAFGGLWRAAGEEARRERVAAAAAAASTGARQ